jgi:SPP1 family predicted phage head-tail adaptor
VKCCELNAGKLRKRIELYHAVRAKDSERGGFSVTENLYATVRAFAVKTRSVPSRIAGNYQLVTTLEVVIRYRADILDSDIINLEGVRYKIHKLDDIEFRKRWHKLELQKCPL